MALGVALVRINDKEKAKKEAANSEDPRRADVDIYI